MTAPFPMIEKALKELLSTKLEIPKASVGGDLSFDASKDDFYVWLGLVSGQTTAVDGYWSVDIDVFDQHYAQAMTRALAIEAALLKRGGHRTALMRLDNVSQNEVPMERPWDDESAFRIGATYVFTARRSGKTIDLVDEIRAGLPILSGEGPPPADLAGEPGQQYLDTLTGDLYTN